MMAAKHIVKVVVHAADRRSRKDVVGDVQDILDAGLAALRDRCGIEHLRVSRGEAEGIVGRAYSNAGEPA